MSRSGQISLLISSFSLIIAAGARYILGGFIPVLYVFLVIFLIGLLVSILLDFRFYKDFLLAQPTKNSMNLAWSLLLVATLLVSIGYLSLRFDKTWDLTEEKINSLSEQSTSLLNNLKEPIYLYIFYKGDKVSKNTQTIKQSLKNSLVLYRQTTNKFKVRLVDTYKNNLLAEKFLSDLPERNKKDLFVFANYKDKKIQIEMPYTEEAITSALIRLQKRTSKEVLFFVGHGEKDLKDNESQGLGIFSKHLSDSGFDIKEWSFVQDGLPQKYPSLVLIVGPRRPFLKEELKWLDTYIKNKGRLFIAIDPGEKHNLQAWLKKYGIDYKNNYIISQIGSFYGGAAQALGVHFDSTNSITKKFTNYGRDLALFPFASEIELIQASSQKFKLSYLVKSIDKSFAVLKLKNKLPLGELKSLGLGVSVQDKKDKNGFHMVVFGDSDFLANKNFYQGVNKDLALNISVALADEENLITIRPKQPKGTKIMMTRNHRLALVVIVLIIPLVFLFLSLWIWYRRAEA